MAANHQPGLFETEDEPEPAAPNLAEAKAMWIWLDYTQT